MKNQFFILLYFPIIICISSDEALGGLIAEESENKESYDFAFQYKKACINIIKPSKNNCALSTLEWKYRCCFVEWKSGSESSITGQNSCCMYLYDKKKYMNVYPDAIESYYGYSDVKINCNGKYFILNYYFLGFFFIFLF